jgi:hypothetical protein
MTICGAAEPRRMLRGTPISTVLAIVLCVAGEAGSQAPAADAGWIPFEANWTASGREHVLEMGDRRAATFELAGPFVVTNGEGLSRGFRARAIGFVERGAMGIARLVLTDDDGDEIWNDVAGEAPGTGRRVSGTITGGTGRYAGVEGSFTFDWQYVIHTGDGEIQGRAVGLRGRYRRAAPDAGAAGARSGEGAGGVGAASPPDTTK